MIQARRLDIVLVKKKKSVLLYRCCDATRLQSWSKEEEKIEKYSELAWVLKKIWGVKTRVIPTVIRALGTVTKRHRDFLANLGTDL